ncbi:penicillin-binding protein activator [Vibrio sp. PP-XX7]
MACSSQPRAPKQVDITLNPTQSAQTYLMRADSSTGPIKNDWLIMALKAAVQEKQIKQANLLLFRLTKETLSEPQLAEWQLARARLLLSNGQYKTALKQLTFKPWWKLNDTQWLSFYQIQASLYIHLERWLDAARSLTGAYDLSETNNKAAIAQQIWQKLEPLLPE